MRHPLRVRSMPGTGKAPARAPLHALLPTKEQGRHLASVGGGGWGTSFQETLYLQLPWGLQAHLAAPAGAGCMVSQLSPCLVAQQGLGRGCHSQPLPRGMGCSRGYRSPGVL